VVESVVGRVGGGGFCLVETFFNVFFFIVFFFFFFLPGFFPAGNQLTVDPILLFF